MRSAFGLILGRLHMLTKYTCCLSVPLAYRRYIVLSRRAVGEGEGQVKRGKEIAGNVKIEGIEEEEEEGKEKEKRKGSRARGDIYRMDGRLENEEYEGG